MNATNHAVAASILGSCSNGHSPGYPRSKARKNAATEKATVNSCVRNAAGISGQKKQLTITLKTCTQSKGKSVDASS
jgi:hypothetical protein